MKEKTQAIAGNGISAWKQREKRAAWFFLLPALLLIGVFCYVSFVFTVIMSFYKVDFLSEPTFVGMANFSKVLHYDLFWKSLANVSVFVVETVGFGLVAGLFFAVLMEQKIKGVGFFRVAFFMPLVISAAATAWIFRLIFGKGYGVIPVLVTQVTGWISDLTIAGHPVGHLLFSGPIVLDPLGDPRLAMTSVAAMSIWGGLGYWILIYTAGLRSIDPGLYESAMIDGAGFWRRTLHITVPLLRPVILFLSITGIIRAFQLFAILLIIPPYGGTPGGPDDSTQVPILLIYNIAFSQRDFGYASALALVIFAILLVITLIQAKVGRLSEGAP